MMNDTWGTVVSEGWQGPWQLSCQGAVRSLYLPRTRLEDLVVHCFCICGYGALLGL